MPLASFPAGFSGWIVGAGAQPAQEMGQTIPVGERPGRGYLMLAPMPITVNKPATFIAGVHLERGEEQDAERLAVANPDRKQIECLSFGQIALISRPPI